MVNVMYLQLCVGEKRLLNKFYYNINSLRKCKLKKVAIKPIFYS